MSTAPAILADSLWGEWITNAPKPIFERAHNNYDAISHWILQRPGHNARLSPEEQQAFETWVLSYKFDLLNLKVGEVDLGDEALLLAIITMIGGVAGSSIALSLGLAATAASAASLVAFVLGAVSIGFATVSILRNLRKRSKSRRLQELIERIDIAVEEARSS